jgi:hypothetical protein
MKMRTKIAVACSAFALICTAPPICAAPAGQPFADAATATPAGIPVAGVPAVSRTQLTGMLKVTIVVQTDKTIPDGTLMVFSTTATVQDQSYSNSHTVAGSAKLKGGKAQLTLGIPYIWVVASKTDKLSVGSFVSASVTGAVENTSYSTSFNSSIALPPNGATTAVTLSGSL